MKNTNEELYALLAYLVCSAARLSEELIQLIEDGRQSSMSDPVSFQKIPDEAVEKLVDIV